MSSPPVEKEEDEFSKLVAMDENIEQGLANAKQKEKEAKQRESVALREVSEADKKLLEKVSHLLGKTPEWILREYKNDIKRLKKLYESNRGNMVNPEQMKELKELYDRISIKMQDAALRDASNNGTKIRNINQEVGELVDNALNVADKNPLEAISLINRTRRYVEKANIEEAKKREILNLLNKIQKDLETIYNLKYKTKNWLHFEQIIVWENIMSKLYEKMKNENEKIAQISLWQFMDKVTTNNINLKDVDTKTYQYLVVGIPNYF